MPDEPKKSQESASERKDSIPRNPYVFISHDSRDADLAEAFSKLLGSVSAGVLKSFRSSDKKGSQGIEYGIEWFPELMKRLQDASDVVCLLTASSLNRPWILFEAGVAKGKLDTPILGVALGIPLSTANAGPFAQFQNSDDEENSLVKVVMQLLKKIPGSEPDEEVVRVQVAAFREKLPRLLSIKAEKPKEQKQPTDETIAVAKVFEEIKLMFNDLPSRINPDVRVIRKGRRLPIRSAMVVFDIVQRFPPPSAFVIALSFFKDDLPFVYEAGLELLRTARDGPPSSRKQVLQMFHEILEISMHEPALRHMIAESDETYSFLREAESFLHIAAEDVLLYYKK